MNVKYNDNLISLSVFHLLFLNCFFLYYGSYIFFFCFTYLIILPCVLPCGILGVFISLYTWALLWGMIKLLESVCSFQVSFLSLLDRTRAVFSLGLVLFYSLGKGFWVLCHVPSKSPHFPCWLVGRTIPGLRYFYHIRNDFRWSILSIVLSTPLPCNSDCLGFTRLAALFTSSPQGPGGSAWVPLPALWPGETSPESKLGNPWIHFIFHISQGSLLFIT